MCLRFAHKVIRVFQAPQTFLDAVSNLLKAPRRIVDAICKDNGACPIGASIPALGLSNKAVFTTEAPVSSQDRPADEIEPDNARTSFTSDGVVLPFKRTEMHGLYVRHIEQ